MISSEEIFVNESHWRNLNSEDFEIFVNEIFTYYRETGFPYYPVDEVSRNNEFRKLMSYNYQNLLNDGVIGQSMHGLGLAWSYFPHAFNVRSNNKMTPYEAFMNDEIFMKVIRKRLKMGTYMSDSGIRKMLKIYSGVQGVSNFRPTAAACIYDRFAKGGVVWDMSGGWGGRLLGAIAGGVGTYIATEPSTLSYDGLIKIAEDYAGDMKYEIECCGSEEYLADANTLDLCFTSPPYFDLEKYADEPTQSYVKFDNKDAWVEGFLRRTFENCYHGLKPKKFMIINIANKDDMNLEWETIRVAQEVGFKLIDTWFLALSNVNLRDKAEKFKYEPIYIFMK